jgi:hypothetical protein
MDTNGDGEWFLVRVDDPGLGLMHLDYFEHLRNAFGTWSGGFKPSAATIDGRGASLTELGYLQRQTRILLY